MIELLAANGAALTAKAELLKELAEESDAAHLPKMSKRLQEAMDEINAKAEDQP